MQYVVMSCGHLAVQQDTRNFPSWVTALCPLASMPPCFPAQPLAAASVGVDSECPHCKRSSEVRYVNVSCNYFIVLYTHILKTMSHPVMVCTCYLSMNYFSG